MYIDRNKQGKITAAYARPQFLGQEKLENGAVELQAFLNPVPTESEIALQELQATENTADLARKIEDITAYIIDGTALPVNPSTNKPYAQEWLEKRKSTRAKIG